MINIILKNLLLPVSLAIWFLFTYYSLYYSIVLVAFMYSISWFWIIVVGGVIYGIAQFLLSVLQSIITIIVLEFYGKARFYGIIHSIAGILALISLIYYLIYEPVTISGEVGVGTMFSSMWEYAWFKTIFTVAMVSSIPIAILHSSIVYPLIRRYSGDSG